jgi:hypothetical protein
MKIHAELTLYFLKLGNQRAQLGTKDYELQDRSRQRLERSPAPLQATPAVVRRDLEARRVRTGQISKLVRLRNTRSPRMLSRQPATSNARIGRKLKSVVLNE